MIKNNVVQYYTFAFSSMIVWQTEILKTPTQTSGCFLTKMKRICNAGWNKLNRCQTSFFPRTFKRRDKNANLFWACAFVLYVTQRNLIIKAKYPPCRVKRGLKTLAYSQGRYPLCSFVQPTFASHRDRATGGTVADKARGLHSHCKSWIRIFNCGFYTRDITHRAGNVIASLAYSFILVQAFHCPHRRLCRYRCHLLYPMHGLHRNPWS